MNFITIDKEQSPMDKIKSKDGCFAGTDVKFAIEPKNELGELHGEVIWNYKNGTPKLIAQYENGKKVEETWYYNDGTPKIAGAGCGCIASASTGDKPTIA
jgi:hypothetical protein